MKLYLLMFVWGPALMGYSAGWLIVHPTDWSGPAVVGPAGLLITLFTYRWGIRRARAQAAADRTLLVAGMIASALVGVMILLMLWSGRIG